MPPSQIGENQNDDKASMQVCAAVKPLENADGQGDHPASEEDKKAEGEEEEEERQKWTNSFDFVLSLIGYAVGVSNLWRFPYLCLKNGGGAFLIPYFFFLFLAGIPLFYMEVCLGQFSGTSSLFVWKLCPLFRGLGYCMIIVSGMACIYYNSVISWILYYLYSSFTGELPWASCKHWWNTPTCFDSRNTTAAAAPCNSSSLDSALLGVNGLNSSCGEGLGVFGNVSRLSGGGVILSNVSQLMHTYNVADSGVVAALSSAPKSAAEEFWQYNVLRKSSGLHDLGPVQLHSAICLLVAWLLVFLCLIRGVKSLGKVVYVTALLPYVLLTVFLVRGAMLPGAADGVLFFIRPDFSRLASFTVWIEACLQVFYSLGPAWGGLITMASFNKFHHNCFRDAVIGSMADGLTSFYGGFVIFSVVGFMAKEANTTVDKIATQGPGLALVAYPEAISKLPLPPLWAVLFFTMLLALGLDSQFGMFETVVSGLVDAFPKLLSRWRAPLTLTLAIASYLVSLPVATKGGIYVFQLLDWYVAAFCVILTSFLECLIVGWIYGVDRFSSDIELMLGKRPSTLMKLCWCFITPFLMLMAFIFTCATYTLPTYDGYVYPAEANALGFFISVIPLLPIPFFMVKELLSHKGSFMQRLRQSVQPDPTWGPSLKEYRPLYTEQFPRRRCAFTAVFRRSPTNEQRVQLKSSPDV